MKYCLSKPQKQQSQGNVLTLLCQLRVLKKYNRKCKRKKARLTVRLQTHQEIENYSLENSVLITYIQAKACFSLEVTKSSVTITFILFSLLRTHFALYKAELNLSVVSLLTSKSPPTSFKILQFSGLYSHSSTLYCRLILLPGTDDRFVNILMSIFLFLFQISIPLPRETSSMDSFKIHEYLDNLNMEELK